MSKQIEITSACVVQGNGSDKVYLRTTLPCGIYPFKGEQSFVADIAHMATALNGVVLTWVSSLSS